MSALMKDNQGAGKGSWIQDCCQGCGSERLESFMYLGMIHRVNDLIPVGSPLGEQPSYPVDVHYCHDCGLVQLNCVIDKRLQFNKDYPYATRITRSLLPNFQEMQQKAEAIMPQLKTEDLIVDVGSNDGSLLSCWKKKGYQVFGIEPTDQIQYAFDREIPGEQVYFESDVVDQILQHQGKAKVICITNTLAHIEDIHQVLSDSRRLLHDSGMMIIEVHDLMCMIQKMQFDKITHEHQRYFCLSSLKPLLEQYQFTVFDVESLETHGGSLRVWAAADPSFEIQATVEARLKLEEESGLLDFSTFQAFAAQASKVKWELLRLLIQARQNGQRVAGVGAPSRAINLVNYCGIDQQMLDYVAEMPGSEKLGACIPGTKIPIVDESVLFGDLQPDVVVMFTWYLAEIIVPKMKAKGFKGDFIIPLPFPE